jgi:hypothetical protein
MASELWHEPPNSTERVKKMNHRSGRYSIWGREEGSGGRKWQVMDGQGPQARVASKDFPTCEEALSAAERMIQENEHSNRGTRAKAP